MIRAFEIENFKSVQKLHMPLGRVTVLIGENGCGKSNILEGVALAAAAARGLVEPEFLASRGIRVTEPEFMISALAEGAEESAIKVSVHDMVDAIRCWRWSFLEGATQVQLVEEPAPDRSGFNLLRFPDLLSFLSFAPENTALRTFQSEVQIRPIGIHGEGLFHHLKELSAKHPQALAQISEHLALFDWFSGFEIPTDLAPYERTLRIRDRYLVEGTLFDQRSANEGFLFLLLYFTLLLSPSTPRFFAIDNVEASLNPKLATELIRQMVRLAREHDRQIILTTHNPAVLDGLDLSDDEQILYAVERRSSGGTRVRRIEAPKPLPGDAPVKLSEAFMRGYIGGLPRNF